MMENLWSEEKNIIKDKRTKLKKEQNYTAVKGIRNLLDQKKKLQQLKKEYLDMLIIFFSMKKKKIIRNH